MSTPPRGTAAYEYRAIDFPLQAYVLKIGRPIGIVARQIGLTGAALTRFAARGRVPVAVYQRLLDTFGDRGMGLTHPPIVRTRQPFRLPLDYQPYVEDGAHAAVTSVAEPEAAPPPPPVVERTTEAPLKLEMVLAEQVSQASVKVLVELLLATMAERNQYQQEITQLRRRTEDLQREVKTAYELLDDAVPPPPVVTAPEQERIAAIELVKAIAGPATAEKLTSELERRLPKDEAGQPVFEVATRAAKGYLKLGAPVRSAFIRALTRFTQLDPATQKHTAQYKENFDNEYGTGSVYTIRASRKLRVMLSRPNDRWRVEEFASRGDKAFYSRER
jgi:hypothetical protein